MRTALLICTVLIAGFGCGCSKSEHTTTPAAKAVHKHEHHPPHGGTVVELGEEEYHVEFVLDAPNGKLQAFLLDGELENFVRSSMTSFEVTANVAGKENKLVFAPVANRATGETVGDTALFEAQTDWLRTAPTFDADIKELTVGGGKYHDVVFNFPKGNDANEKEDKEKP